MTHVVTQGYYGEKLSSYLCFWSWLYDC